MEDEIKYGGKLVPAMGEYEHCGMNFESEEELQKHRAEVHGEKA